MYLLCQKAVEFLTFMMISLAPIIIYKESHSTASCSIISFTVAVFQLSIHRMIITKQTKTNKKVES